MNLLEIKDLKTYFDTSKGLIKAVDGVSLCVKPCKTLGIIGESGSGKSQTAMSILKLFEKNQKIHGGEIVFDGKIISNYSDKEIRKIRGNDISVIFQEPMTALNPVFTVERQITEVLMLHQKTDKKTAKLKACELLKAVRIPNPESMSSRYPHELSGGMRQRVMIAIALACKPRLLIADEPTTALDVTIQAQILLLINELKQQNNTAVIFITHDLSVIKIMADDVAVMYCGSVVELCPVEDIFSDHCEFSHPYTRALLESIPSFAKSNTKRLKVIEGNVPSPLALPDGCKFAPRCEYATKRCLAQQPDLVDVSDNHKIRCFYPHNTRKKHV